MVTPTAWYGFDIPFRDRTSWYSESHSYEELPPIPPKHKYSDFHSLDDLIKKYDELSDVVTTGHHGGLSKIIDQGAGIFYEQDGKIWCLDANGVYVYSDVYENPGGDSRVNIKTYVAHNLAEFLYRMSIEIRLSGTVINKLSDMNKYSFDQNTKNYVLHYYNLRYAKEKFDRDNQIRYEFDKDEYLYTEKEIQRFELHLGERLPEKYREYILTVSAEPFNDRESIWTCPVFLSKKNGKCRICNQDFNTPGICKGSQIPAHINNWRTDGYCSNCDKRPVIYPIESSVSCPKCNIDHNHGLVSVGEFSCLNPPNCDKKDCIFESQLNTGYMENRNSDFEYLIIKGPHKGSVWSEYYTFLRATGIYKHYSSFEEYLESRKTIINYNRLILDHINEMGYSHYGAFWFKFHSDIDKKIKPLEKMTDPVHITNHLKKHFNKEYQGTDILELIPQLVGEIIDDSEKVNP